MSDADDVERDKLITELILRVSAMEKLLIDKKIIVAKDFSDVFEASVKKLTNIMNEKSNELFDDNKSVFIPGSQKN